MAALDQELRRDMTLLGELGVVQGCIRRLEIGAAVLPVGIEEQRIEPAIEIVMARDIVLRARRRIELLGVADEKRIVPWRMNCPRKKRNKRSIETTQ
jgi:hypothetical protein